MAKDTLDKYGPKENLGSYVNIEKIDLKTKSIIEERGAHYPSNIH